MTVTTTKRSFSRETKRLQVLTENSGSNTIKDPDNWITGDEPMTDAQQSYLTTLSTEAGEDFSENLTKAEASKRIDELQHKTCRALNCEQI